MPNREQGQALLFVLLAVSVLLSVGLSAVSRSVSDISITNTDEESLRAFSAAEAGIENALSSSAAPGSSLSQDLNQGESNFQADVTNYGQGNDFNYPFDVVAGDSATVWFMSHDAAGALTCSGEGCFTGQSIKVCWGSLGSIDVPAVETTVVYVPNGSLAISGANALTVARAAYDPSGSRAVSNSFSPASGPCTIGTKDYSYSQIIDFNTLGIPQASWNTAGGLKLMRIRMLYNTSVNESFGVTTTGLSGNLPSQGKLISSTGISGTSQRKVEVFSLYAGLPTIFDSSIFSAVGLTK